MEPQFPIFMAETPKYEISGDLMHIRWRTLEIVLPVSIMLAGMGAARREIAEWQERNAAVIKINRDHAA